MNFDGFLKTARSLKHQNQVCVSGGSKFYSLIHLKEFLSSDREQIEPAISTIAMTKQDMRLYTKEAYPNLGVTEGFFKEVTEEQD